MLGAQHRHASWGQRRTPALQPPCSAAPCPAAPVLCSRMRRPACLGRQAPQACCSGSRRPRRPRDDGAHDARTRCSLGNAPKAMLPGQRYQGRSRAAAEATLRRSHWAHVALTSREVHTEATRGPRTGHAWTGAACSGSPATRRCPPRGQAGDDGGSLQFCILQILGGLPSVCMPVGYLLPTSFDGEDVLRGGKSGRARTSR